MMRAAVLAVLLVPAAVIGLDTPLVMADNHLPEGAFVTTWKATNTDKTIKIPVGGQTGNYTVDWGDGTDSTTHVSDATHEYITAGDYTVSISGDFKRIFLNGVQSSSVSEVKNAKQLRSIEQWGDMEWSSMTSAFRGASKMVYNAVDTPDLSNVKSMEYMFHVARAFNGNLSSWNVSQVTNMGFMYQNARAFNGDISSWNVSAVTDMNNMFNGASSFNQTLNDWDVSKVTNTYSMFEYASDFNGDISSWNVSAVTDMNNMFNDASSFNQTLNDWDVLKVTDMSYMFSGAEVFNQPLNDWNVSAVTDMSSMFDGAYYFNGDISRWNVSAVTDMNNMFNGVSSFNQTLNDWDVLKVTDMSYMFSGAEVFNQPLNDWDVSKVNNTYGMFEFASSFNGNISSWNVSAVTNMNSMFSDASSFNQTLNNWNVSKVTDMSYMFLGAAAFNQPLNGWDVSKVTNTVSMFEYASSFNQPLNDWDVSKVTDMYYMFSSAAAFNQPLNNWDVSKVTDMYYMFSGAEDFNQPLNNWNVSAVTSMRNMFSGASSFEQNLGKWYVVPADTVYNTSDEMSLVITTIAAQNSVLDGHSHYYGIGTGGNSALFSMTGSNLVFKVTPSAETYKVNVTAPEGDFGTNNHRVLDITVEGQDDSTVSADAFVTTWNVTASPYIISIPVEVHAGGMLTIDWGDNVITTVTTNGTQSHTYSASDEYQVSMTGDLSRIILGDVGSTAGKLASIDQWGDIEWSSMKSAFPYTHNMKYNASDVPNLSGVSNMGNMFTRALKFDGDLSEWNVSAVTDMHSVFTHASSFNGNVSTWNVSAVTDMGYMFNGASVFNGDISSWNVSAVTNMRDMFDSASVFNGDISRWNVSAVTNMAEMFHIASDFNGDISGWNVSAVTDMNRMFSGASVFNGDISGWNVSAVTDMHRMFSQAFAFNGDISSWNVSSVTDMSHMFSRATSFDSDISGWNVSSVKDTSYMFSSARSFNQPLNSWNVSAVTAMTDMFSDSRSFNQNLGEWYIVPAEIAYDITDASLNVTVISAQNSILDDHNPTYGIDPDNSHDSGLFNMTGNNLMFKSTPLSARVYTVNVTAPGGDFGTNNHHVFDITVTGEDRPLLVDAGPDQRVLDESAVTLSGTVSDSDSTDLTYLWTQNPGSPAVTLTGSDTLMPTFTAPDVSSDVDLVFTLTVDDDTDTVTDTVIVTVHDAEADFVTTWNDIHTGINLPIRSSAGSFTVDWGDGKISEYAAIATDLSLVHLYDIPGTYAIRISGNFSGIFLGDDSGVAGKLQSIDQWGDIKWTTMAGAFSHAGNMLYNATDVPDLSSVTDMSFMFARTGFSSDDLSGWNVSGVTDMRNMFLSSGYTGDLSGWDVSSVTDMQNMFSGASSFDSDLSSWNVSAVTYMNSMFSRASSFNSDLSGWDVSSVTGMRSMFSGASSFDSDLSEWDVSAVLHMDDMFSGATSFEQNLGPWYIVLDSDTIFYPTQTLEIMAQNSFLDGQNPMYGLGVGGDSDLFVVDADAGTLGLDPNSDPSPPPNEIYQVNVTSTGNFGTANHRMVEVMVEVTVDNADPAVTPPTFDSSVLNTVTGVLRITFSETIDVTPAANIVPTKIHIRESGNYTGGITLSAVELGTTSDDATISFTLNKSRLAAVAGLTPPELTIEPGAVQDTFGNLIDGTFDVSTAVFVNATSVSSQDTKPYGIAFSNNGTKMFVVGDHHNNINQYTLSTPFDISNATYDGNDERFSVSSQDTSPRGMAFSNDGLKMFVVGYTNKNINQYALSSPFDVSTANFTTATSSPDNYPRGIAFSNNGTKMFVVSSIENAINQYTLSNAFDLSTVISVTHLFDVSTQDTYPKDMAFSNDGAKMFVVGSRGEAVNEYTLSPAFDVSTAVFVNATSVSSQDGDPAGMAFSNDGAKMFVVGAHEKDVNEYALSSVYPITVTNNQSPTVTGITGDAAINEGASGTLTGTAIDDDGTVSSYSWNVNNTAAVTITTGNAATLQYTALQVDSDTPVTFTLTVTDDDGATGSGTYDVTINNLVANQSPTVTGITGDAAINEGASGTLTGTAIDDDGTVSSYSWNVNNTAAVTITTGNAATLQYTALQVDSDTPVTFTLTVTDDDGATGSGTYDVTINNLVANQSPTVTGITGDAAINEGASGTLTGTAIDDDGTVSSYSWNVNNTAAVTITTGNAATLQYTALQVDSDTPVTFTLTVTDDDGATGSGTYDVTINNLVANQSPTVTGITGDAAINEGASGTLTGTAIDDDGTVSSYSWNVNNTAAVTITTGNAATLQYTALQVDSDTPVTFTLTVTDDDGATGSGTYDVTINNLVANQSPTVTGITGDAAINEGASGTLTGTAIDDDGTVSSYSWNVNNTAAVTITTGNAATLQYTALQVDSDTPVTFTLTVTDDDGATGSGTYDVTINNLVANQSPTVTGITGDAAINEGASGTLTGTAIDDDGTVSSYSWNVNNTAAVTITTGNAATLQYTALQVDSDTPVTFTLTVTDDDGATGSGTYDVTINNLVANQSPTVTGITGDAAINEGASGTLTGTAIDDDGTVSSYSWNVNNTAAVTITTGNAATLQYTALQVDSDTPVTFTLTVTDDDGATGSGTYDVTINNLVANQSPTVTGITGDAAINEGASGTLTGTAIDDDGTVSSYSWNVNNTAAVTITTGNAATLQYTALQVDSDTPVTFTLTVTDDDGATGSGTYDVTINNLVANQSPTVTGITGDAAINEGASGTLTGTAIDDDGTVSSYSWNVNNTAAVTITTGNAATLQYTALQVDSDTPVTFTLTVTDDDGATGSGTYDVTINNLVANQSPTVTGITGDAAINEGASGTLTGTAIDDDGTVSSYSWNVNNTAAVTITTGNAATLQYTALQVDSDTPVTFTLTVTDDDGATGSGTYDVTINNLVANQSPTVTGITGDAAINEGASGTLTGTAIDDDGTVSSYSWNVNNTAAVTITTGNAATLQYTALQVDSDTPVTFTLTVTDDDGATGSGTYDVTINNLVANQSPTVTGITGDAAINEGASGTLTGTAIDDDGTVSSYSWNVNNTAAVTITTGNAATLQYTALQVDSDTPVTFTLTVTDDDGATGSGTYDVTINNLVANQSPTVTGITGDAAINEGASGTLTGTAIDDDGTVSSYSWNVNNTAAVTITTGNAATLQYTALQVDSDTPVTFTLTVTDDDGATGSGTYDVTINNLTQNILIDDASGKSTSPSSSSKAPAVHINALAQARIVDIPPHIAEQVASHDASDPLEPIVPDGTFDFPLVINGYGYLLDDTTNTLVPQTVAIGDGSTIIAFTVYTQKDLAHFTLYLNLQGENTDYTDSDTYITYKNDDGTTGVTDPHGYIGSATITVTQEDDSVPEKKTVRITVEFGEEPMDPTNMVAYMWNTDRKAVFVKIIDAIEVVAVLPEPVMQAADPEPLEPDSVLPADPEPVPADDQMPANPEPVPSDVLWPADDYDEAQVLTLIRMWSGFESEFITDEQMLTSLGFDYLDADIPDWMMTQLGVLVVNGDVTVEEFVLALQYVLENL